MGIGDSRPATLRCRVKQDAVDGYAIVSGVDMEHFSLNKWVGDHEEFVRSSLLPCRAGGDVASANGVKFVGGWMVFVPPQDPVFATWDEIEYVLSSMPAKKTTNAAANSRNSRKSNSTNAAAAAAAASPRSGINNSNGVVGGPAKNGNSSSSSNGNGKATKNANVFSSQQATKNANAFSSQQAKSYNTLKGKNNNASSYNSFSSPLPPPPPQQQQAANAQQKPNANGNAAQQKSNSNNNNAQQKLNANAAAAMREHNKSIFG